jgi:hypothetical protein
VTTVPLAEGQNDKTKVYPLFKEKSDSIVALEFIEIPVPRLEKINYYPDQEESYCLAVELFENNTVNVNLLCKQLEGPLLCFDYFRSRKSQEIGIGSPANHFETSILLSGINQEGCVVKYQLGERVIKQEVLSHQNPISRLASQDQDNQVVRQLEVIRIEGEGFRFQADYIDDLKTVIATIRVTPENLKPARVLEAALFEPDKLDLLGECNWVVTPKPVLVFTNKLAYDRPPMN